MVEEELGELVRGVAGFWVGGWATCMNRANLWGSINLPVLDHPPFGIFPRVLFRFGIGGGGGRVELGNGWDWREGHTSHGALDDNTASAGGSHVNGTEIEKIYIGIVGWLGLVVGVVGVSCTTTTIPSPFLAMVATGIHIIWCSVHILLKELVLGIITVTSTTGDDFGGE